MAEVLEYSLVVLVSSFFVAGSAMAYSSYSSFAAGLQFKASSAALMGIANGAYINGTSQGDIVLPASTISCTNGLLIFRTDSHVDQRSLPVECDFSVQVPGGPHLVRFADVSSDLRLTVT